MHYRLFYKEFRLQTVHYTEGVPLVDDYKTTAIEDEDKIYCNCCGKEMNKTGGGDMHMDYLHIEKTWGYFSAKDLTTHTFNICEKCYDKWVASFIIPVEEGYIEERCAEEGYIEDVFPYSEEDITLLNEAYQVELSK